MITSYSELAKVRQRELVERAEQRRLERHGHRSRPARQLPDTRTNESARAA